MLKLILIRSALLSVFLLAACVQAPTEKQGVSDLRPTISFDVADEKLQSARVLIDGLDVGPVAHYLNGVAAVRVRPGTHIVKVSMGQQALLEEKIYLGDGVNRSFVVK